MAEMAPLKYHAQALRLLGRTPRVCAEALLAVEGCEGQCGVALPAAVREWYLLEGAVDMLAQREGACGPASLAELLEGFAAAVSAPAGSRRPWVRFYGPWRVNTGYEASLILDGSDDPPIHVDPEGRQQAFSSYVRDMAWWKTTFDDVPGILVGGPGNLAGVCGPAQLDFLSEQLEELPREPHPFLTWAQDPPPERVDLRGFRFFRPGGRVAVTTRGDPTAGDRPAGYELAADTEEALFDLYEHVWPCHGVPVELSTVKPTIPAEMKARFLARFPAVEVRR